MAVLTGLTVSEKSKFDQAVTDIAALLRLLDLAGGAGCSVTHRCAASLCGDDKSRYQRMTQIAAEMDWVLLGRMVVTMTYTGEDHFNACKVK